LSSANGKEVVFGIRPEDVKDKVYVPDANPGRTFKATVEVVEPMGAEIFLYLNTGTHAFTARVDAHDTAVEGQELQLVADMEKSHFFDKASGDILA